MLTFVGLAYNEAYNHAISVLGLLSMFLQFPFRRNEPDSNSHSWQLSLWDGVDDG
jgi:hypothetical protein